MNGKQEVDFEYYRKIQNIMENSPDYFGEFFGFMQKSTMATKYNYLSCAAKFVKQLNKPVTEIVFGDFLSYMNKIERKENGEEITPSYKIAVYSALKKFCKYLFVSGKIEKNFMEDIERPKFRESKKTIEKRSRGFLTEKETEKYLKTLKENTLSRERQVGNLWNKRDNCMIKLLLQTGIRCAALRKLDTEDFDAENSVITVTDKGEKVRKYELNDGLKSEIAEWLAVRKKILADKSKEANALFISNRCERMNPSSIARLVNKYAREITDKNITPHKLRATYGTYLYNETRDLYFVQKCMGHSNPKTTEIYTRGQEKNLSKAADILGNLIK